MELKLTPATFLGIYLDFEFSDLKTTINPDNLSKNSGTNSSQSLNEKIRENLNSSMVSGNRVGNRLMSIF